PGRTVRGVTTEYPRQEDGTRSRLVTTASNLLAHGGPTAVTLRRVGELAGVSRTAPYRHFRDKRDLLSEVAPEGFVLVRAEMEHAIADPTSGPAGRLSTALERCCVAYVRAGLARPEHYRLMFGRELAGHVDPALEAAAGASMAFFLGVVSESQRAGTL